MARQPAIITIRASEEFEDDEERRQFQQQRKPASGNAKSKTPVLDNFGRDITKFCRAR